MTKLCIDSPKKGSPEWKQRISIGQKIAWDKRKIPIEERFWSKVLKTESCWIWNGTFYPNGYGMFGIRHDKFVLAHRFSYELEFGEVPKEPLVLDHLCNNRGCVNPRHLQAVTVKENLLRGHGWSGVNSRKTHCPKGHPLSGSNLSARWLKKNRRVCLTCIREKDKARNRIRRQKIGQQ